MAKFVFELEAVLKQRKRAERDQQRVVAELERERIEIESEIRRCQQTIRSEKDDLASRLGGSGGVDLGAVRIQANASLHLINQTQQAVLRLAGVHNRIDRARLELLDRARRRRAIEVLREQRFERWKREQDRREQSAIDELAVMAHGRNGDAA